MKALSLAALVLLMGDIASLAQPEAPPQSSSNPQTAPHVTAPANVRAITDEAKAVRTPREVIQAIRSALRARLAVTRH
jgi:hypothetical protein